MGSFFLALLCGLFFGLGVYVGSIMREPEPTHAPGASYDAMEPLDELDEAKERNMAAMLQVAADAWQGKSTWWQDEQR